MCSSDQRKLLQAQSNLAFYAMHQSFMIDEEHIEFFKNMIGRFYDVPKCLWKYYAGKFNRKYENYETTFGLILLENMHLYNHRINGDNDIINYKFHVLFEDKSKVINDRFFNKQALEEYSDSDTSYIFSAYFSPCRSEDRRVGKECRT